MKKTSERTTTDDITMLDTTVRHPALKFTAVLENDPGHLNSEKSTRHFLSESFKCIHGDAIWFFPHVGAALAFTHATEGAIWVKEIIL